MDRPHSIKIFLYDRSIKKRLILFSKVVSYKTEVFRMVLEEYNLFHVFITYIVEILYSKGPYYQPSLCVL